MNKMKEEEIRTKFVQTLFVLVRRVFKTPQEAAPLMSRMNKMMEDKDYIPDKMFVFPGHDLVAEEALRDLFGRIFERRI